MSVLGPAGHLSAVLVVDRGGYGCWLAYRERERKGLFSVEKVSHVPTQTTNTRLPFSAVGGLVGLGWRNRARGVSVLRPPWRVFRHTGLRDSWGVLLMAAVVPRLSRWVIRRWSHLEPGACQLEAP